MQANDGDGAFLELLLGEEQKNPVSPLKLEMSRPARRRTNQGGTVNMTGTAIEARLTGGKGQPTALYRHFDAAGRLLYVGISIDPNRRLREHSYESDWFDRVVTVKVERFPTQAEAAAAERAAVIAEKPENNSIKFEGRKRRLLPTVRPMATGDTRPSWQVCREIEQRVANLNVVKWRTIEGCANRLLMDPEVLRDNLIFIHDRECRLKKTDVLALADMVIRGVLSGDNPWIVGSPLPALLATQAAEVAA